MQRGIFLEPPIKQSLTRSPISGGVASAFYQAGGFAILFKEGTLGPNGTAAVVSRAEASTRYNSSGILENVAAGKPVFTHDLVTLVRRGLKVDGELKNLVLQSNDLSVSPWSNLRTSATQNAAISPDGTQNATRINGTSTSSGAWRQQGSITVANASHTAGMLFKSGTKTDVRLNVFDTTTDRRVMYNVATGSYISSGAVSSYGIFSLQNNWKLVYLTNVLTATSSASIQARFHDSTLTADDNFFAYGAMLFQKPFMPTYIPNTSSSVTKGADNIELENAPINSREGFCLVSFMVDGIDGTQPVIQYSDGTDNNYIELVIISGTLYLKVYVSGAEEASVNLGSVSALTRYSVAFSWGASGIEASLDGANSSSDSASSMPSSIKNIRYGSDNSSNYLYGIIEGHGHLNHALSGYGLRSLAAQGF